MYKKKKVYVYIYNKCNKQYLISYKRYRGVLKNDEKHEMKRRWEPCRCVYGSRVSNDLTPQIHRHAKLIRPSIIPVAIPVIFLTCKVISVTAEIFTPWLTCSTWRGRDPRCVSLPISRLHPSFLLENKHTKLQSQPSNESTSSIRASRSNGSNPFNNSPVP